MFQILGIESYLLVILVYFYMLYDSATSYEEILTGGSG